ncbi:MAG: glutamate--tRNA ligase [Phycisphaerales bacterium]|nr:glutamate--tRNA ligase [Phycisphaerales bacterium]
MVITRFAPSPTGHLHIGGARTALFCWAYARRHGGRFLLRIEDTDQARSSDDATRGILEDLAWLGIDWDEGPTFEASGRTIGGDPRGVGSFYQSERRDLYESIFAELLDRDLVYPAFESAEELDAKRAAAVEAKRTYRYDRAALEIPKADRLARMKDEPHVLRFHVPDERVVVRDVVLGEIAFDAEHIDDLVVRKRDGFPTYHFAVIVDDEHMGVTHIMRGQEHLNNTPRHVAMQQALGYRIPTFAHLPLIFNQDGSKMSKRDKDKAARAACKGLDHSPVGVIDDERFHAWLKDKKSQLETSHLTALANEIDVDLPEIDVEDFRRSGYLPSVLKNYVALLGWNPGDDIEKFDMDFLCERFDFDRVGKSNSKFDRTKLASFNADAFQAMDEATFAGAWRTWLERERPDVASRFEGARFDVLASMARPRASTFRDALAPVRFALIDLDEIEFDAKAARKALFKGEPGGIDLLREIAPTLGSVTPFEADAIEAHVKAWCEARDLGMGRVAQPLRIAMTGTAVSPPLGQTLEVLGAAEVARRIEHCLASCVEVES